MLNNLTVPPLYIFICGATERASQKGEIMA